MTPPTISEKPITAALTAANRAYEDNVSFNVRDRISSQVSDATRAVSDATNDFTRRASEGIQELLGVDTAPAVEEPQQIQQGGGIIPTTMPQMGGLQPMSPVTINVINGGSDNAPAPVNQNGGKKRSTQDGGDIFNFKGGFSKQDGGSEEQYGGDEEQEGGDEEQEGGSSNSKVIKLA